MKITPEERRARARARYVANREKIIARAKEWYAQNGARARERQREYNRTPQGLEVWRRAQRTRAARKRNTTIGRTSLGRFLFDVFADQRDLITALTGVPHEVDHIVPLHAGGPHDPWNLRIVTRRDNGTAPKGFRV